MMPSDIGPFPSESFSAESLATTTAAIVVTSLLVLSRERIRRIVATQRHRRELRRIIASRENDESGSGSGDETGQRPIVSGVYVHPVKSLRPVAVSSSSISNHGLACDRRLMLIRPCPPSYTGGVHYDPAAATHRFVTQRQCPSLATIQASLPTPTTDPDGGDDDGGRSSSGRTLIKLSSSVVPGSSVHVDVTESTLSSSARIRYRAGLWDDVVDVVDVGDEAAEFVRSVMTKEDPSFADVRVAAMIPGLTQRHVDGRYLPAAAFTSWGSVPQTSLNDGFPILVACEASLGELNRRLEERGEEPIPMSRFRPNIVIRGTVPFEEDEWKAIRIGGGRGGGGGDGTILHVVKGCPRCKQSCTDQETGERGAEPLETLATFRALGTSGEDVYFAQNAVLQGSSGTVSVGDEVAVLTRGDPVWDKDTVQAE